MSETRKEVLKKALGRTEEGLYALARSFADRGLHDFVDEIADVCDLDISRIYYRPIIGWVNFTTVLPRNAEPTASAIRERINAMTDEELLANLEWEDDV